MGWAGMESRLDAYRPLGRRHLPIGLFQKPTGRLGGCKACHTTYRPRGADKYLSAVRWPIGAKIPLGRIRSK